MRVLSAALLLSYPIAGLGKPSAAPAVRPPRRQRVVEPMPQSNAEFAELMSRISFSNQTLIDYFFPLQPRPMDVQFNYWPHTSQCRTAVCWSRHVVGSLDSEVNPHPPGCEIHTGTSSMHREMKMQVPCEVKLKKARCMSGSGKPCLGSSTSPGTVLASIALARAGGITHIIEEGRENGLTARASQPVCGRPTPPK